MKWPVALAALTLSACGSVPKAPAKIERVVEKVPVLVSCVPANLRPKPTYSDTDARLKGGTPSDHYSLVIVGRAERDARLDELEPVIKACSQPGT